ncbi:hypothetical protein F3Y22_tig00112740pilonHSYRG00038 [Hibiscus syriacus]|uniref:Uncharacterized protein n=1 Tax=Hibiscus syriacus TaxID=106335 RepID=A0A6A2WUJ4_HIBSY|nr:uncharacterized protein LOC120183235 [Hibiscus syriacus]KAE8664661.1 hypothetical protein F3Y22_tig00112740pilonHSYRG00038 [Hibiscus syriacus]
MGACASKPKVLKDEASAAGLKPEPAKEKSLWPAAEEEVEENMANEDEEIRPHSLRYLLDNEDRNEETKKEEAIIEGEKKEDKTMAVDEKKEEEAKVVVEHVM